MTQKIRKGDLVEVISGAEDDKGKKAEVIKVSPDEGKVVIQGVNMRTKHQRPVQSQNRQISPGKVRFEAAISSANVMVVCPKCGKPTRIAFGTEGDKKVRKCKKCQALIDG